MDTLMLQETEITYKIYHKTFPNISHKFGLWWVAGHFKLHKIVESGEVKCHLI